jgi:hypothetical protein
MLRKKGALHPALCALGAVALIGAASPVQPSGSLAALSRLEPGQWQIRALGKTPAAPLSLCVADPAILMQVQHRQMPCSRLVIASDSTSVTVHYTCPANGFGRTSLRFETPRLAKIDTQGIMDNVPFAFRAEARRVGACAKPTAGR